MSKRTLLIVLAILFVCLIEVFARQQNVQAASLSEPTISEISIEHTPCHGTCPVYKLTLRSDGTVTFIGVAHVGKVGTYIARFGRFNRLAQAIAERRFQHFSARYTSPVTDMPHTVTTVVSEGKRKSVDDYAHTGPQALWEIETLIDGVVAEAEWKKVSSSTNYH